VQQRPVTAQSAILNVIVTVILNALTVAMQTTTRTAVNAETIAHQAIRNATATVSAWNAVPVVTVKIPTRAIV
jgi:hypothetical protein